MSRDFWRSFAIYLAILVIIASGIRLAWGDDALLAAMRQVESSGNDRAVGDGGSSRGPLQIQRGYWADAVTQLRREGWRALPAYDRDVWDYGQSCIIVRAYWRRWCVVALNDEDAETLARVHNGGPRGASRRSTLGYWKRVQRELKKGE